ncbi:16S rRNA (adenine(1518)-N(6)/adenine(1519)-N(6))-dimethyltransferase RsmA [Helicobacter zhangjianzhongii]|uniref:16S rRNA (Adenine(1518)-N(6)/adenine(1519)-N(6))-dimethyltransferase RsmA n=1 Tax=Helicobacter zhangjianzhongii TaxID=2974574 RepID=A0ACC6FQZ5_9HELI|nr:MULTISPECIES: 16S rRNA (adenine(1518)-N(6)/adenine(1519)-N(6))-dimethyltransferase RsmA [unclassified Helicobacter]MDL0079138.1 16S rRNA (adenine(1518)-N(6)/adenine(1519)-N(6))-dimethyltransferase RsmA [Helicobacter sp. CPD2-1]MDL0081166.1 16S rRNA (adenine(1518)-N(6)/adenine(1519)-N(6))-dimethyltransferase RsmA [Helicobacter sp. XJK30-2]
MRAKKRFGQNFLKDPFILDQIVQVSAELLQDQKLIEIGVGLGDLSERLLSIASLTTYEIDADLCSFVLQKFSSRSFANTFSLVNCDVLSISLGIDSNLNLPKKTDAKQALHTMSDDSNSRVESKKGWLANEPYILVSNLPYNIATRIVLNLLHDPLCEGFVVMTQKEVALKFCADTLSSDFCALSVIAQSAGEMALLFDVSKESFDPMPKVTSSVFRHKKSTNFTHIESGFESMLKMAFSSPRKKLFNNLLPFFKQYEQENLLDKIFAQESIEQSARPHQISTQKYHHIYNTLKDHL